jgi:nucleoside-diphosphate-sugar epimerase
MRVLVAGGTGVIGRQAVPLLIDAGHEVVVLARGREPGSVVAGARLESVDALDAAALAASVAEVRPDAVVNLLSAIPASVNPARMARQFAQTNRLRTEATSALYEAAGAAGATSFVAASIAFAYPPSPGLQSEDTPLWDDAPKQFAPTVAALAQLEGQTIAAGGTVLRFGHLYGPGTALAADGAMTAQIRGRKVPIVGDGGGVFSFLHARDAAQAVVAALAGHPRARAQTLNIIDDEPVALSQWLPAVAELLGAKAPRSMPRWMAKPFVGDFGLHYMQTMAGADNARARDVLDWRPLTQSWRDGLCMELAAGPYRGRTSG